MKNCWSTIARNTAAYNRIMSPSVVLYRDGWGVRDGKGMRGYTRVKHIMRALLPTSATWLLHTVSSFIKSWDSEFLRFHHGAD